MLFASESLNLIEESDATNEAKQVPHPELCQPAIDHDKQEVTCQETVPIIEEVKSQELISPTAEETEKSHSAESETEGENTTLNMTIVVFIHHAYPVI